MLDDCLTETKSRCTCLYPSLYDHHPPAAEGRLRSHSPPPSTTTYARRHPLRASRSALTPHCAQRVSPPRWRRPATGRCCADCADGADRPSPYAGHLAHRCLITADHLADRRLLSSDVLPVRRDHWRLTATGCQCAGGSRVGAATATAPPLDGSALWRSVVQFCGRRAKDNNVSLLRCPLRERCAEDKPGAARLRLFFFSGFSWAAGGKGVRNRGRLSRAPSASLRADP